MADNSTRLNATGATETLASDDIAGVKYQRVKLNIGPDGSAVDVLVPADSMVAASAGIVPVAPELFNETTHDRQRGNTEGTLLASAARTATVSAANAPVANFNARGVIVWLNITITSGTGGLQANLFGRDPVTAQLAFLNATPAAITATGIYGYELYPGSTAAGSAGSNLIQQRTSAVLPRTWGARVTHGDASSYTYSLGYSLIV